MKKTNILVFDGKTESLVTMLSNKENDQCPFFETDVVEQLNKDFTFEFSVPADHEDSQHLKRGNLVGFFDLDGDLQVFQIYKTEEEHTGEDLSKRVFSEHLFYEMIDDIVQNLRVDNEEASAAMIDALASSRWESGVIDSLGLNTMSFYYSNGIENIQKVANEYGGELGFRLILNGNSIAQRLVDLKTRRGSDTGKRFEFTKDLQTVKRTEQVDGLKTALYGRGKGEETETGGYTRKVTFADVVWNVASGDPVDKPSGQEWIGDPQALANFGRENGTRHRIGTFDFDTTDPIELIQKTWQELQRISTPRVTYELSVMTLEELTGYEHEKVRLGDTVYIIDRDLGLTIEARVLEIKRDLVNPENTEVILGNFIDDITDYNAKIEEIEATLSDRKGVWDKVEDIEVGDITDGNLENIAPSVPANISAQGLFKSIILKWTFDPSILVSAYEVYGSKVNNFTPDASNLLFRGKSGGFVHSGATNETWYFRVRALNPHGVASAFTQQFSASTIALTQPDFENLTVTNAMIENVSGDKITFGTLDGNKATIVNIDADQINTGRLKAQYVEIGSTTVYQAGYDPTTKATPENVSDAEQRAKDYSKPIMKDFYDESFSQEKDFWSNSYEGQTVSPTTAGTIVSSTESDAGGVVWRITGGQTLYSLNPIPINPNRVYRVTFRVRQTVDASTVGKSSVYAGVSTLDSSFQNITGGAGTHRYCTVAGHNLTVDEDWQTFTGLISGEGDAANNFRAGTVYVRPMFIVNYNGGDGTVEVDYIKFEDVTEIQQLNSKVDEVILNTTQNSIVAMVTSSTTYQTDVSNKADKSYVDNGFTTKDELVDAKTVLEGTIDTKINDLDIPALEERVAGVEIQADEIDFKVTHSGGVNLLKNSTGYAHTDFWSVELDVDPTTQIVVGTIDTKQDAELQERGAGAGFVLDGAKLTQTIVNAPQYHTLSGFVKKGTSGSGYVKVTYDNGVTKQVDFLEGTAYDYKKFEELFETTGNTITVEIYGTGEMVVTGTMLNIGNIPLQWQHSAGEVYNTNVLMDLNGIRVISNVYEGYTAITPEEFAGYAEIPDEDNNLVMTKVFTLNKDVTEMSRVKVDKEIGMTPIKVIPIQSTEYNGWAFIGEE
jgi:phage minor structural protein